MLNSHRPYKFLLLQVDIFRLLPSIPQKKLYSNSKIIYTAVNQVSDIHSLYKLTTTISRTIIKMAGYGIVIQENVVLKMNIQKCFYFYQSKNLYINEPELSLTVKGQDSANVKSLRK